MGRLQGKFALITGGTNGIGLETARQFLAEGATVAVTGRNEDNLKAAARDLAGDVVTIRNDAGSVQDQVALAAEIGKRWGRLDILYVNAGDTTYLPLESWKEEDFDRLMAINLKGPFFLIQALLPIFSKPASIVLCSSVTAHKGQSQSNAYAASKAALLSLARTLSGELMDRGIRVNCLSPGPTVTAAFARLGLSDEGLKQLFENISQTVPLGRMGTALEMAKAAVYLASDESSFVIGTELLVDGGMAGI